MLKNGQTYLRSLAVETPQDFLKMLGYFLTYAWKGWYILAEQSFFVNNFIFRPLYNDVFKIPFSIFSKWLYQYLHHKMAKQTISWTGVKILKRPSEKQDKFMIYYYYVLYD